MRVKRGEGWRRWVLMVVMAAAVSGAMAQPTTLIPIGATWKYRADGTDQGTAWTLPAFDDSAWATGAAQLGYGDGDEATVIPFGPNAANKFITSYFRRQVVITDPALTTNVLLRLLRDDGAIVYVNGREVFRSNLPDGFINFRTLASIEVEDNQLYPAQVPAGWLTVGTNVVAVEVHQASTNSSDLSFSLDLTGYAGPALGPPQLIRAPQPQAVVRGGSVRLEASVFGTVPIQYRWLRGTNTLTTGSTSTNDIVLPLNSQTVSTNFTLIATNLLGAVTSAPVQLTILTDADVDRVPDVWETSHGFATNLVADATADADGDQQSNRSEFVAGTNPTNAASLFVAWPPQTYATAGERILLGASATNAAALSFQWYLNGAAVLGARSPTLEILNAQPASSGSYTVVATNYSGSSTSVAARVDIVAPYSLNLVPGWQMIANQFDRGNNTLDEVLPNVPDGCVLFKVRPDTGQYEAPRQFYAGSGWEPKGGTLVPGEGAFLYSPANAAVLFTGRTRVPVLPPNLPGGCSMVSRQIAAPGDFASILDHTPAIEGENIFRWSTAQQRYVSYTFVDGLGWSPSPPVAAVGEAWWSCRQQPAPPNMTPYVKPVSNQVVQAGSTTAAATVTVLDVDGPVLLTLRSSNSQVLSSGQITLNPAGSGWTVNASPNLFQSGSTEVTVTASDGVASSSQVFTVNVLSPPTACCRGFLERSLFYGIGGNDSLTNLTANPRFPAQSTNVDYPTNFFSAPAGTNYGAQLLGVLIPPVSGAYQFQLAAARTAELSLSSDETYGNLAVIAAQTICCNAVQSAPIPLLAGRKYVVRALLRATSSTDSLEVRWRPPGAPAYVVIPGSSVAAVEPPLPAGALAITAQPTNQTAAEGLPAALAVAVQSTYQPVFYQWQWQRPGDAAFADLPGANAATLSFGSVSPTNRGTYRCLTSIPGRCFESSNAVLTVVPASAGECVRDGTGTDFWLTFAGNTSPDLGEFSRPYLEILGAAGTTGRVDIAGLSFVAGFLVNATGAAHVTLPSPADLGNVLETAEQKGVHVSASAPVSVVAVNDLRYTTDAFRVSPTETLGQSHVVLAYGNHHEDLPSLNGSQFALVATRADTTVTFHLSTDVGTNPASLPLRVVLQAGQTYQLRATNNGSADLTGTRIDADQPIALFAGHQCATIPSSNVFFCNYVVEQVPAVPALGTNFVAVPFVGRPRFTVRCVAAYDDTLIRVSGAAAGLYQRGSVLEFVASGLTPIVSTRPIAVAQFGHSSDDDGKAEADPTMISLLSSERWATNVQVVALTNFTTHVNVVVRDEPGVIVKIDGADVALGSAELGYRYARPPVSPGTHRIQTTRAAQVMASGYSQGRYDAYGYLAGGWMPELVPPTVSGPTSVVVSAGSQCSAPVPAVSVTAASSCPGAGALTVVQAPAPGSATLAPRIHAVTNTVTDARGAMARWVTTVIVQDLRAGTLQCPTNVVVECTNGFGNVVQFQPTARNACGFPVPVRCSPPSGSLFAVGTNIVTCRVDDPSGPTNTCAFTVTVLDRTSPIIQCSSNLVVQATDGAGAAVPYRTTASDNCDPVVAITCIPPANQLFPVGQTVVNCVATDDSGNHESCSFTIRVVAPPLVLAASTITNNTVTISFNTTAGTNYVVEYRTNLTQGGWTTLTNVIGPGGPVQIRDSIRTNIPGRFYRLRR